MKFQNDITIIEIEIQNENYVKSSYTINELNCHIMVVLVVTAQSFLVILII